MPKNFEPKVRIGFTQSPERYKEFFVWKIYFDPKCCFGQKKLKIDGTFKNCPWGYGTIYAKVQNFLGLYNFFQNNISFILFRAPKKCTFDNAAAQLSPRDRKCFAQIRKRLKKWKKNLTPNSFPWKVRLARRVQFCKPFPRKIRQKWSWINQNTKRTKKLHIFQKNYLTGKRSLDT